MTVRLALAALLAGVLLLGLGRVALLPPFEGYDETGHYSYAAEMAALGTWPARGDPMSAEAEDYLRRAPGPPSAGGPWRYAALAAAPAEARAAARAAAASPTGDPRWRPGAGPNWEAQHPPLYYGLLAPAFRVAEGWSLKARLLLLRGLSIAMAWAGLCCAAWAAAGRGDARGGGAAEVAALAPALWPLLLPGWFPEMARLGNDALVALLAGAAGLGAARLLAPARSGLPAHVGLGAVVGLGLLAKATFLPLAAALGLGLVLLLRCRAPGARRAGLLGAAAYGLAILLVAGWWYVGQALRTGDPIGANDGINLARGEGLSAGLRHHLTAWSIPRMVYDFDLSLVWGGTWSFAVPPLPTLLPMMAAFPALVAAGLWAHRRDMTLADAVAPLTLALFTLALVYYSLVLIAGGGLGQPAWYLHAFAPVLWPLLAWGLGAARRGRVLGALLAFDLVYAPLFLAFATACDAAFYAGCAGTRGGDRYIDVSAALACWAEPARLLGGLDPLAYPPAALALLASGFALVALGIGLAMRLPAPSAGRRITPRTPSSATARSSPR